MGNSITKQDDAEINDDNILGKYIKKWAEEDYNPFPKTNKTIYKNSLKKRACCTKQKSVPISLPDVENNKIILSAVSIPIFSDIKEITEENCTFDRKQFKYTADDNGSVIAGSNANGCADLYGGLCDKIIEDRQRNKNYSQYNQYYSVYGDDVKGDAYTKINPYVDCNCKNSILVQESSNFKFKTSFDVDTLAQSNDPRCSGQPGATYKTAIKKIGNVCIQNMGTGNISAEQQADLKLSQTCGINDGSSGEPEKQIKINEKTNDNISDTVKTIENNNTQDINKPTTNNINENNSQNNNQNNYNPSYDTNLNSNKSDNNYQTNSTKPTENVELEPTETPSTESKSNLGFWLILILIILIVIFVIWFMVSSNKNNQSNMYMQPNMMQPNMMQPNMMQPNMMQPNMMNQYMPNQYMM